MIEVKNVRMFFSLIRVAPPDNHVTAYLLYALRSSNKLLILVYHYYELKSVRKLYFIGINNF